MLQQVARKVKGANITRLVGLKADYSDKKKADGEEDVFSEISDSEAVKLGNAQGNEKYHPGYIGTANSFYINEKLRRAALEDINADPLRNLSDSNKATVKQLDKAMKPIGKNIEVIRFVDWQAGTGRDGFKATLEAAGFEGTERSIKGAVLQFPAFTSTSWNVSHNFFKERDTILHINAPKTAKAMIDSKRTDEAEIILARNTQVRIDKYVEKEEKDSWRGKVKKRHIYLTIIN